MTWTGLYRLELTCDRKGGAFLVGEGGAAVDTLGHVKGEFPHVYIGEIGTVMRQNARRDGWMVAHNGAAVCPKCTKKPTRREDDGQTE